MWSLIENKTKKFKKKIQNKNGKFEDLRVVSYLFDYYFV